MAQHSPLKEGQTGNALAEGAIRGGRVVTNAREQSPATRFVESSYWGKEKWLRAVTPGLCCG